jgi:REJ domain
VTNRSSFEIQQIEFTQSDPLLVDINCVKNCGKFALIHELFHAQIVCDNCTIQWTLDSIEVATSSHLILKPFQLKIGRNSLKVTVVKNKSNGDSEILIMTRPLPVLKDCKISPTSGIELLTLFTIICESDGVTFHIYQDDYLVGIFYSNLMHARLMRGREVEVRAESHAGALAILKFAVSVEMLEIKNASLLLQLGNENVTSLHELIQSNDVSAVGVLIHAVIGKLSENVVDDDFEFILNQMSKIEIVDRESIEIVANILREICENFNLDHNGRKMIGIMLEKISDELGMYYLKYYCCHVASNCVEI